MIDFASHLCGTGSDGGMAHCMDHPIFRPLFPIMTDRYGLYQEDGEVRPDVAAELEAGTGERCRPMREIYQACRQAGCMKRKILEFQYSRCRTMDFRTQSTIRDETGLVILPTVPLFCGQSPWMVEIEDITTLFFPYVLNGQTSGVDVRNLHCFIPLGELLKHRNCKAIVTHVESTAKCIGKLYPGLESKTHYIPLCSPRTPKNLKCIPPSPNEEFYLLFTNSWHGQTNSFLLRGGLDVLHAFKELSYKYPKMKLMIRSTTQGPARELIKALVEFFPGRLEIIDGVKIPDYVVERCFEKAHIFLLPAARLHAGSLLEAQSYGIPVITSDGWGCPEYAPGQTVVKGRWGVVSWTDKKTEFLYENYRSLFTADMGIVKQLVSSISSLVENPQKWIKQSAQGLATTDKYGRFGLDQYKKKWIGLLDSILKPNPV